MHCPRHGSTLALLGLVALLHGCGSGDQGVPTEVEIHDSWLVHLTNPNGGDGAALFAVAAPGVRSIDGVDDQVYLRQIGDKINVMVLRPDPGLLTFRIQLRTAAAQPDVQILQVSSGDNRLRDVASYGVVVTGE